MADIYEELTLRAKNAGGSYIQQYGKVIVDFDNDVEVRGGTYRELTIITISSPWKVRPIHSIQPKKWWQHLAALLESPKAS